MELRPVCIVIYWRVIMKILIRIKSALDFDATYPTTNPINLISEFYFFLSLNPLRGTGQNQKQDLGALLVAKITHLVASVSGTDRKNCKTLQEAEKFAKK